MRILFVITGLGGGGAEKVVADLADQIVEKGHQVKIAYLKGDVVVCPKNTKIELIYLGFENLKTMSSSCKNYKKLISDFKPDVVHSHMVHANIFTRISRKFFPVPKLICTAHSNNEGGRLRMLAYKLTHSLADLTTNVSRSASLSFEKLGAVPKGEITTIYNGIDLNRFKSNKGNYEDFRAALGIGKKTLMFLAVGRLHEAKDYPNLIRAFSILKLTLKQQEMPKLFIAGEGGERNKIEALLVEHDLVQDIFLLGRRDDIPDLMNAADVFILSSSFEGFGLVVAEAMACECFVIATDCGGVKEVMGGNGMLLPVNDSSALALAIQQVSNMSKHDLDINNQKSLEYIITNFSLDHIIDQWIELYES